MHRQINGLQYQFLKFKMLLLLLLTIAVSLVELTSGHGAGHAQINGSCPPWHFPDQKKCSYSNKLPQILNQYQQSAELQIGYCITVTNSGQVVSRCPYTQQMFNSSDLHSIYRVLPCELDEVNETMCSAFNRKGFLCSECQDGYGLAVYRYYGLMCVKCSHSGWGWLWYILLEIIPSTLFFLVIIIFRVNVNSGSLTGFVFLSNIIINTVYFYPVQIMLMQHLAGYWPVNIVIALYGIWSLELLHLLIPPFCVSSSLTTLQVISLGYISALYPLLLSVITYCLIELHARDVQFVVMLWKPFQKLFFNMRKPWNIQYSVVHSFATFLLLSYAKIAFVSLTLLQTYEPVTLNVVRNTLHMMPVYSVDLGAQYFDKTHAPYGVLSLCISLFFVIIPLVLILAYPTRLFPKLASCCGVRRLQALRTFMEVFQGCYKDGISNGSTRDYRMLSGLYLIGRLLIGVGSRKASSNDPTVQHYGWLIPAVPFILVGVLYAVLKPYRQWRHNVIDVIVLLWIAKMSICVHVVFNMSITDENLKIVLTVLVIDLGAPQAVLLLYLCYKLAILARNQPIRRVCDFLRNIKSCRNELQGCGNLTTEE